MGDAASLRARAAALRAQAAEAEQQAALMGLEVGPVIFLDIDGVLNYTRSALHINVEPQLMARLRQIVDTTSAHIVLSTFWRNFESYIAYVLHRHGIESTRVIGRTPGCPGDVKISEVLARSAADDHEYAGRAAEIKAWLAAHPEVDRFVILDDRNSASDSELSPHFVQTQSSIGLTDKHVTEAIRILSRARGDASS